MSAPIEQHDCKGDGWVKKPNLRRDMSNATRDLLSISGPRVLRKAQAGDSLTRVLAF
jgi:hypothetical protein